MLEQHRSRYISRIAADHCCSENITSASGSQSRSRAEDTLETGFAYTRPRQPWGKAIGHPAPVVVVVVEGEVEETEEEAEGVGAATTT